ncbi:MAG: hypothetical protein JW940_30795 [Polyangiaceae bacterium]|nr:hypothetical protein [Polyangiaceae bacterium]
MPPRFHINTRRVGPRVRPVGKLGIVDFREDCASCANCVKRRCVYGLYRNEADRLAEERGYLDYVYQCKGCLCCVQNCTKGLLERVENPEYARLGRGVFTPETVLSTWFQAETGAIPVSGSGYGGPFSGSGFDAMWTDMSEIVRPTRDGIHGREYINVSVDIGRKLDHLEFEGGQLRSAAPPLVESPLPVMFDVLPERCLRGPAASVVLRAAAELGLFAIVRDSDLPEAEPPRARAHAVRLLSGASGSGDGSEPAYAPLVVVPESRERPAVRSVSKQGTSPIIAVRAPTTAGVTERVLRLAREGAEVINLVFDADGRELVPQRPRHMCDVIREVHGALVREGLRDELTLMSSGGIALAEHVVKAIICGIDLVAIDLPLVVALECRLCGECERGAACPIAWHRIDPEAGVQRIVNLMAAWHAQLIEMLGAMGLREVRRLRGETGRAMFFEDLERSVFGRLFGKRRADTEVCP